MAKILLIVVCMLASTGVLQSQSLPPSARHAIDQRFSDWTFRATHISNPCDQYGVDPTSFPAVKKCNLNDDGIPDFGIAIITGSKSNFTEYFLALVSNGQSYDLFMIDSATAHQGAGERRLVVVLAGDSTACFSGDGEIWNLGHPNEDGEMIIFPVDALRVLPECESRFKEIDSPAFVFVKGQLRSFGTAD